MNEWYIILPECSTGMESVESEAPPEIYLSGRVLPVGSIIPSAWFSQKRLNIIHSWYIPKGYIQEYVPTDDEYPMLYMFYKGARPQGVKFPFVDNPRIGTPDNWANVWYEVIGLNPRNRLCSVPYGISALVDIEGICNAGDTAFIGDIIPAPFLAGISESIFNRLENVGLCATSWLTNYARQAEYLTHLARPAIRRANLDPFQKELLYEKYPAMRPKPIVEASKNVVSTYIPKKTTKKKDS